MLGALNGQFEAAFSKVTTLHTKNKFDLAIVSGALFASPDDEEAANALLEGRVKVPLSTYFTDSAVPFPPKIAERLRSDEDICENLHYISQGIISTTGGVRIAAAGGPACANGDRMAVDGPDFRNASQVDVLLTPQWPQGVWRNSAVKLGAQPHEIPSTDGFATLCENLKPRYHFTSSPAPFFFEREPFVHSSSLVASGEKVTRFVSMAPFGNAPKAKALYAFTLPEVTGEIPIGTTRTPFFKKRPVDDGAISDVNGYYNGHNPDGGRRKRMRFQPEPVAQNQCFFCLGNPEIETHMCCNIGEESYITVAKGPLTTINTYEKEGLTVPNHLIIIPFMHQATLPSTNDPESTSFKAYKEMERYREALQAMVATTSKYKCGAVTWEISRAQNVHLHWQFVAVPTDKLRLVETAFRVEAENQNLGTFETRELTAEEKEGRSDYFRVWVWVDDGEDRIKGTSLVMPLTPRMRFDLQLGRRVLAKLLGLEVRTNWRDCQQTVEEEKASVTAFNTAFSQWDFS